MVGDCRLGGYLISVVEGSRKEFFINVVKVVG